MGTLSGEGTVEMGSIADLDRVKDVWRRDRVGDHLAVTYFPSACACCAC